jgi:hypothetical protein
MSAADYAHLACPNPDKSSPLAAAVSKQPSRGMMCSFFLIVPEFGEGRTTEQEVSRLDDRFVNPLPVSPLTW